MLLTNFKHNTSHSKKQVKKIILFFLLSLPVRIFASNSLILSPQDSLTINKAPITDEAPVEVPFTDSLKYLKVYYGKASFYSRSLEGTRTSNDEIFRHNKLTAASNKFKLGTWLRVTNLSNEKSIIVRVNDRMHPKMAARGRIVDLSRLGAQKLDFIKKGIVKVKVQVVPKNTKE